MDKGKLKGKSVNDIIAIENILRAEVKGLVLRLG